MPPKLQFFKDAIPTKSADVWLSPVATHDNVVRDGMTLNAQAQADIRARAISGENYQIIAQDHGISRRSICLLKIAR